MLNIQHLKTLKFNKNLNYKNLKFVNFQYYYIDSVKSLNNKKRDTVFI